LTDDPLLLDFFALRMRLNGLALSRLSDRNRMKEVELQMRGANVQFADVKCEVLREGLKELRVGAGSATGSDHATVKSIHIANHGPSNSDGERAFTGRFTSHSVSRESFKDFLRSRHASGVVARGGSDVLTHFDALVEGEDYVLVRGGFDAEDTSARGFLLPFRTCPSKSLTQNPKSGPG
jgi:hypothetical protein